MASKNPVRGYIRCHMPNCSQIGTVHAVGEHKILTKGEPPKNKRNVGRLYFQCPTCGYQQGKGDEFQSFILANMAETREALAVSQLEAITNKACDETSEPVKAVMETVTKTNVETGLKPENTKLKAVMAHLAAIGTILIVTSFFIFRNRTTPHERT
ncbi:hypothetical protein [Vibrio cortegadensis]|uniref:hypothetical protein n=1 Tax=Vibrio cortegadensis TaxID=1328770 RepID=UPI00352FC841